ncbi:MarR family winged helix-turn-helix transcriptional regulator [Oceanospirillum sediminis]|uniref:MarR family transcriptional regulator n=1 Tax=Oceanospirillum sediminis TaxID=2760088 RepID=A0A839IQK0_9GAMM|nr:MarR family transcriptional regulator [Oceanospirillum sediminis]MBB1487525.1 MarR family transcriptional regulator [Oceanospirillum sediminis]
MSTCYESLDLTLCAKLGRVHRICRQAVTKAVEPMGFTQPRWTAIMHIDFLGEGCSQQQLAQSLGIEMPSLTRTLQQLEQSRFIERRVDEQDKRSRNLYFTAAGSEQIECLKKVISQVRDSLYAGLTDDDLKAVDEALRIMEANAQRYCQQEVK